MIILNHAIAGELSVKDFYFSETEHCGGIIQATSNLEHCFRSIEGCSRKLKFRELNDLANHSHADERTGISIRSFIDDSSTNPNHISHQAILVQGKKMKVLLKNIIVETKAVKNELKKKNVIKRLGKQILQWAPTAVAIAGVMSKYLGYPISDITNFWLSTFAAATWMPMLFKLNAADTDETANNLQRTFNAGMRDNINVTSNFHFETTRKLPLRDPYPNQEDPINDLLSNTGVSKSHVPVAGKTRVIVNVSYLNYLGKPSLLILMSESKIGWQ